MDEYGLDDDDDEYLASVRGLGLDPEEEDELREERKRTRIAQLRQEMPSGRAFPMFASQPLTSSPSCIPIHLIDPDPDNPRKVFNKEEMFAFAKNIDSNGMLQPIGVQQKPDGRYLLVYGERRFRAAKIIGWREIPACTVTTTRARIVLQLSENQRRANLLNSELGNVIESLLAAGKKPRAVAIDACVPEERLKFYRIVPKLCPALAAIVDRSDIRAIYDLHIAWERGSPEVKGVIEAWIASLGRDGRVTQAEAREFLGRKSVTDTDGPCWKHDSGPIQDESHEADKPAAEIPLHLRDRLEDLRPKPLPQPATEPMDGQGRTGSQTSRWRPSVKEFRKMEEGYREAKRTVKAYETACARMLEQVPEDLRVQVARILQDALAELKAT